MLSLPTTMVRAALGWRAAIDILLIATILVFCFRTLRRLGTWKIGVGVLAAMGLFVTARALDLRGIEWIYLNLSSVALIALIVVFQPEIRRVLERAASLRRAGAGAGGHGMPGLIADSMMALARQKWGAIVVLPGKEPIDAWVSGGFLLDAHPSHPLIMSLFDPHSAGHDGAVIVQGGKLSRFAVRLPLSHRETLPPELGTRHHAAMGLAELSDALILVVSEERGSITLFANGLADVVTESHEIARRVTAHWQRVSDPAALVRGDEAGRRALLVQVGACTGLAFLFWASTIATHSEIRERMFSVPVEYITAAGAALVGEKPMEVKVHVAGPKADLDALIPAQLAVRVDLSREAPGEHTIMVTAQSLKLPRNISLLGVEPSGIPLALRRIVQLDLAVSPQLIGAPPPGFTVSSVSVVPPRLRALTTAGSATGEEPRLMTSPIYLEGIRRRTVLYCKVAAPPNVQPVERRWPDVEVIVSVTPTEEAAP